MRSDSVESICAAEGENQGDGPGGFPSRSRLADAVCNAIATAIRAGEIAPGTRLPSERDLMRRYAVSRTAVREAIAALASRGLVRTRPGYRPVVEKFDFTATVDGIGRLVAHLLEDQAGVLNLFETRIFLEAALARHAAAHAARADIAALEAALAENHASIGDRSRFYATDVAFHNVLYRIPRNPIYPAIHKAYVDWLTGHWMRMPRSAEIDRTNFAGHEAIFRAIVDRDADRAERMLRSHLSVAWEFVRATFSTMPQAAMRLAAPADAS